MDTFLRPSHEFNWTGNHVFIPGLRLADKRSFPCPRRTEWILARDELYEEIMTQAWNSEKKFFCQSYEDKEILDSAVLIMPLVFFCAGVRFSSFLAERAKALTVRCGVVGRQVLEHLKTGPSYAREGRVDDEREPPRHYHRLFRV